MKSSHYVFAFLLIGSIAQATPPVSNPVNCKITTAAAHKMSGASLAKLADACELKANFNENQMLATQRYAKGGVIIGSCLFAQASKYTYVLGVDNYAIDSSNKSFLLSPRDSGSAFILLQDKIEKKICDVPAGTGKYKPVEKKPEIVTPPKQESSPLAPLPPVDSIDPAATAACEKNLKQFEIDDILSNRVCRESQKFAIHLSSKLFIDCAVRYKELGMNSLDIILGCGQEFDAKTNYDALEGGQWLNTCVKELIASGVHDLVPNICRVFSVSSFYEGTKAFTSKIFAKRAPGDKDSFLACIAKGQTGSVPATLNDRKSLFKNPDIRQTQPYPVILSCITQYRGMYYYEEPPGPTAPVYKKSVFEPWIRPATSDQNDYKPVFKPKPYIPPKPPEAELLGFTYFPTETQVRYQNKKGEVESVKMGGLSGCAFDPLAKDIVCVSDKPSEKLFFDIDLVPAKAGEKLATFKVKQARKGQTASEDEYEDIAFLSDGTTIVSTERNTYQPNDRNGDGYIWSFTHDLKNASSVAIADGLVPAFNKVEKGIAPVQKSGLRGQKALEALSVDPSERFLVYGTEAGPIGSDYLHPWVVVQDLKNPSNRNVYRYVLENLPDNGLSAMVALSEDRFLTLERSYDSYYNSVIISIFIASVPTPEAGAVAPGPDSRITLKKEKLIDLDTVAQLFPEGYRSMDNFEAMMIGPEVDGKPTLILATDDNFDTHGNQLQMMIWIKPNKSW